jgi:hypothetical protein
MIAMKFTIELDIGLPSFCRLLCQS